MHSRYDALCQAQCEELNVRAAHRGRYRGVAVAEQSFDQKYTNSEYLLRLQTRYLCPMHDMGV